MESVSVRMRGGECMGVCDQETDTIGRVLIARFF